MHGERTEDLPFYINQIAEHGKRVLELGCGTGRLTIPLALQGFDVTGIDIEEKHAGACPREGCAKGSEH